MIRFLAALVAAALIAVPAVAQRSPVPLDHLPALKGDYFPLRSSEADHLYHIYVRLPEGYAENPERRYPVVYVLDGDSLFPILAANHLFLTYDDELPEAVIVGISYGSFAMPINRRHIDCMPPAEGVSPGNSGTAAFQRFLESELLPAVERRYRTDPERRILYGQARCGAMVLYSAFTDPDLFWARIASNPSINPGREIFFGQPAMAERSDLRFVVTSGTDDRPPTRKAVQEWLKFWEKRSDAPWSLKGIDISGGTHAANSTDAYRAAMRWLFETRSAPPQQVQPMNFLPAIAGDYFPLASTANGTTYHIYIRCPQGYAERPGERYPIVYLLDGDSAFPLLATQHLFLTIDDKIPEAVIVGIAYGSFDPTVNRRDVDFGPRADSFNRFVSAELIPAVESRVRADSSRRILVGQSFGGGYVLYSALTDPDLFWARIASNPSFRLREDLWDSSAAAKRDDLRLFVIDGTANHEVSRQTTAKWVSEWNAREKPWALEHIELEGGTHAADIGNGYRAALRRLFPTGGPPAD